MPNLRSQSSVDQNAPVKDAILKNQLKTKSIYYANIIIWTVIFLYPLLGILDYIYANNIYQILILIRVIIVVIIYVVYDISLIKGKEPNLTLHTTFLLISLNAAVVCNIVSFDIAPVFFLMYASLLMLFNLAVFWAPINSFGHFLATLIFIAIGFHLLNDVSVETFITQGAGLFIMAGFFSCFIPMARYGIIVKNTVNDIRVKKANTMLGVLQDELMATNQRVEVSNQNLTEMVMKQDAFLTLIKKDILCFTHAISDSISAINMVEGLDRREAVLQMTTILESNTKLQCLVKTFPTENVPLSSDVIINLQKVNLYSSVSTALAKLKEDFDHHKLIVNLAPKKLWPSINLDQLYLNQLLFNLFWNCLKFSQNYKEIKCDLNHENSQMQLVVYCLPEGHSTHDNIPLHHIAPTVQSLQKGLGPGFYIARLLAEKMNGNLTYHQSKAYIAYELTFSTQTI